MTCQDRKRDFSQAIQLTISNRDTPVPNTMTASSLSECSTPMSLNDDKENESPFDQDKYGAALETPGALQFEFHWPPATTPHPLAPTRMQACLRLPLQILTPLSSNVEQATGESSLPIGRDGFRPSLTLSSDYSIDGDILGYANLEPGFAIHDDDDTAMSYGPLTPLTPLTPSVLNMQELSLLDIPNRPLPNVPTRLSRPVVEKIRASVYVEHYSHWAGAVAQVLPNDVIIIFGKGKQFVKVNKYPLCAASRFFTQMLDGPFIPDQIRIIRLRDDFPYAIRAMIDFIDTGSYTLHPSMSVAFPTTTMLDLHIHAYLAGTKYDIPNLASYALAQYIDLSNICLQLGIDSVVTAELDVVAFDPTQPVLHPATAMLRAFLESLAFLWRNTPNRLDDLRAETLELLKLYLNRLLCLPFFATLMQEVTDFASDLTECLGDDGLAVSTYYLEEGETGGVRFA